MIASKAQIIFSGPFKTRSHWQQWPLDQLISSVPPLVLFFLAQNPFHFLMFLWWGLIRHAQEDEELFYAVVGSYILIHSGWADYNFLFFFFIYFICHCRILLPVLLVAPFNLTMIYLIVGGNGKLLVVTVAFLPFQL